MRDPAAFDQRYRSEGDPWDLATTPYELDRYARIVDALGDRRYHEAYEPGCAVGVLTEQLAHRCDHVLAVDLSATAVALAAERCGSLAGVELRVGSMQDPPPTDLDLIVFSEVGYYVDADVLAEVVDRLVASLRPDGLLVGCHWLGHSADHVLHGDAVHEIIGRHPLLRELSHQRHPDDAHDGYRLDTWTRR